MKIGANYLYNLSCTESIIIYKFFNVRFSCQRIFLTMKNLIYFQKRGNLIYRKNLRGITSMLGKNIEIKLIHELYSVR